MIRVELSKPNPVQPGKWRVSQTFRTELLCDAITHWQYVVDVEHLYHNPRIPVEADRHNTGAFLSQIYREMFLVAYDHDGMIISYWGR